MFLSVCGNSEANKSSVTFNGGESCFLTLSLYRGFLLPVRMKNPGRLVESPLFRTPQLFRKADELRIQQVFPIFVPCFLIQREAVPVRQGRPVSTSRKCADRRYEKIRRRRLT